MKKIEELVNFIKSFTKGTYAGVRFDEQTQNILFQYAIDNKIPNPVSKEDYHTTLLYSRKYLPNYKGAGKIDMYGTPAKLEIWKNSNALIKTSVLVLRFESSELSKRHNFLMGEHHATYDFPTYIPHITLSYNVGDLDISTLPKVPLTEIHMVEEYSSDLNEEKIKK